MISLIRKSDNKLVVTAQFHPESMSLNLDERGSTATLTVGSDAPAMTVGGWLRDETGPGKGTVWRIRSIDTDARTETLTVQLDHIVSVLRDTIMFGEVKTTAISGRATATPLQAVSYILNKSSDWTVGSVGYTEAQAYEFNGDSLYDAMETVSGTLEDCWWTYDLSVYPFKLSIVKASTEVACEMRMGRNISTLKRSLDLSRMYTRLYPVGQGDLHIAGDYVQKNTGTYGVISKVETDNSITDAGVLKAWANARLARHCEPALTVTISGQDLSEETGVALDRLTLGTVCRVPLPEFGTTIQERIVKMSWRDKVNDPMSVTVTLANELEDAVKIIASQQKSAGRSARAASKKAKEDNAWFEDTNDHVSMCARSIIGVDAQGNPNWERLSRLDVGPGGMTSEVSSVQNGLEIANSKIEQNETSITQTVQAIGKDGKITAGSICLAINKSGDSEAVINAKKIYLLGETIAQKVTAEYIKGKIATISLLNTKSISCSGSLTVSGAAQIGSHLYAAGLHIGTADNSKNVKYAFLGGEITKSGNTCTLKMFDFDGTEHTIGTFNSADAVTLKDPVWTTPASSSITGNSNTVTVETNGRSTEVSKSVPLYLVRSDAWSSGTRYVYITKDDTAAGNRVARIDVTIPSLTVQSQIATYGNTYPTSINGGNISKSGITTGKYMTMTVRCGGKDTVIRFYVAA